MSYLPDAGSQARAFDREFAYRVVAGLRPEYIEHILNKAISQRNILPKSLKPDTKLLITLNYIKELLVKPFISSKLKVYLLSQILTLI